MNTWHYIALFAASAVLTAAGFFLSAVPFVVAYLPFGLAILIKDHRSKAVLASGHYIWAGAIAAWGLIQLDHSPLYVVPLAFMFSCGLGWISARITVGLSAALMATIPFIPDNPLLVTGSILPEFGLAGLALLAIVLWYIERKPKFRVRAALFAGLIIPALAMSFISPTAPIHHDLSLREVDISDLTSITRTGRWSDIGGRIKPGHTAILGENIFDYTDVAAISYWCRTARNKKATLFIGVRGARSIGEVWTFNATTCPAPGPIYHAQIGIPTVTGGWLPNAGEGDSGIWGPSPDTSQWIACFEGFSLFRWIGVGLSGTDQAIAISNDKWTEPFPVGALRRKVGAEFAKLLGINVFYAETGRSFLMQSGAFK